MYVTFAKFVERFNSLNAVVACGEQVCTCMPWTMFFTTHSAALGTLSTFAVLYITWIVCKSFYSKYSTVYNCNTRSRNDLID